MTGFARPPKATRHCRHYSYIMPLSAPSSGPNCAAGIDLSGPRATLKCMPDPQDECASRAEYTDAERAAWESAKRDSLLRLEKAVQALPRAIPLRTSGRVDCPNCDGKLCYMRWHRGAEISCTTAGCCGARFNIAAGKDWPERNA